MRRAEAPSCSSSSGGPPWSTRARRRALAKVAGVWVVRCSWCFSVWGSVKTSVPGEPRLLPGRPFWRTSVQPAALREELESAIHGSSGGWCRSCATEGCQLGVQHWTNALDLLHWRRAEPFLRCRSGRTPPPEEPFPCLVDWSRTDVIRCVCMGSGGGRIWVEFRVDSIHRGQADIGSSGHRIWFGSP